MYLFNARAEGDRNKENDPDYKGMKGIVNKPAFRKPIRSQRCFVIADCFIEGTIKEKLNKPFVVYLKEENRPFSFAGIYDSWVNKDTGELLNSFAIITTTANKLLQKLPHDRSPVILKDPSEERLWLDNSAPMAEVVRLLNPYPYDLMNAYPIEITIKNPRANGRELLKPKWKRVAREYDFEILDFLELHGMGMTTGRREKLE